MTVIIVVFEGESNMKEYLLLCFSVVKVLDGLESKVILYPEGGKVYIYIYIYFFTIAP